jgi:hypothetical protein
VACDPGVGSWAHALGPAAKAIKLLQPTQAVPRNAPATRALHPSPSVEASHQPGSIRKPKREHHRSPEQEEVSVMAELHILQLQCLNREDPVGRDEATLQINGNVVSGPHLMVAGDVIPLNVLHSFTGIVDVNLIEQDGGGVDDFIGTVSVPDTLPVLVNQTGGFLAAVPNANYNMDYHLHP